MKMHLKFIFLITAITVSFITLCQLYWVYSNYRSTRTNFVETVNYVLRQSVDKYQLSQNKLPVSLTVKNPTLSFLIKTSRDGNRAAPGSPARKDSYKAEFVTVPVDEQQMEETNALVARLLYQSKRTPIDLDRLTEIFQQGLVRNHITDLFRLTLKPHTRHIAAGEMAAVVNFYKDPLVIKAECLSTGGFFFSPNFAPALVSSVLVLLSALSLLWMVFIIKRQMRLDKMKTDFINNIVHELRTPLSILKSSNEAMVDFGAAREPESLVRYLNINTMVIDDMDANIARILNFTVNEQAKQVPVYETVDLRQVIDQAQYRFSLIENVVITVKLEEKIAKVNSDRYMLGSILVNLLDNAIKYSPSNAEIEILTKKKDHKWQILVADHGKGIPHSELPYIFDKFYRITTGDVHDTKGYGIGLTYVKQLVSALNGTIGVDSQLGKGTIFTLTFFL